ncbi:MAG: helix-turn-helix transcriptional regulator [Saprospiraceae bacterium]|nr:helix-turn-helix transcriptional regulator [Saprospiraceae bacterium]
MDELVTLAGVSKPTLHRYFKENYAQSPLNYVNQERLNRAVVLIETGKKSVAEVGRAVGINDTSYFIKLFRQRFGMTPKQYVKQNTTENKNS